jgi:hypothetical protein
MQRVSMLVLAVAALAACSDTYADRNAVVGTTTAPTATTPADPIATSGQSSSPTSGSVSNTASGSRGTQNR